MSDSVITHQSKLDSEKRQVYDPKTRSSVDLSSMEFPQRKIELGPHRLQIPSSIEREMARLDQIICERNASSEVGGIGLTTKLNSNSHEVVEFIAPRRSIFIRESRFSRRFMSTLENIADTDSVQLVLTPKSIRISNLPDSRQICHLVRIQDSYTFASVFLIRELLGLRGITTEDNIDPRELADVISTHANNRGALEVETRLDAVMTTESMMFTDRFWQNVYGKTKAGGVKIGFHMHHHPHTFGSLSSSPFPRERRSYFQTLLTPSAPDKSQFVEHGIEFSEIRALGAPNAPLCFHNHITRRFFRVHHPTPCPSTRTRNG